MTAIQSRFFFAKWVARLPNMTICLNETPVCGNRAKCLILSNSCGVIWNIKQQKTNRKWKKRKKEDSTRRPRIFESLNSNDSRASSMWSKSARSVITRQAMLHNAPLYSFDTFSWSVGTTWKLRVSRLNTDPKNSAMTVHVNVMTLYGMLKSGVGRLTSSVSVYTLIGLGCMLFRSSSHFSLWI